MAIMTIPNSFYNVRRLLKLDWSDLFTFVRGFTSNQYLLHNAYQYRCTFFEGEAEAYVAKICESSKYTKLILADPTFLLHRHFLYFCTT